jgi:hypothetical protein
MRSNNKNKNKLFRCDKCANVFDSVEGLTSHKAIVHSAVRIRKNGWIIK